MADLARAGDVATLADWDPLRTVAFAPHTRVELFAAARAAGLAHVLRRGALYDELPGIIRQYEG